MNINDIKRLIQLFPNTNIIYSYGQTEASPRVTYIEKNNLIKHLGSCGKAIDGVAVDVVNSDCISCNTGEIGEIVVQGPNVMLGYYLNDEKTRMTVRNGKLYTGDYGYFDEEGFLYLIGRRDNMIISAGKNIYPEEIEGVIMNYPGVLEVLVIPKIKSDATCELYAYVVTKENTRIAKSSLFTFCKEHLELYKIPKDVYIVGELEKTSSGKIIRKQEPKVMDVINVAGNFGI